MKEMALYFELMAIKEFFCCKVNEFYCDPLKYVRLIL